MRWDVDPILVDLGFLAIRWYGALFASGVLIAATMFARMAKRRGFSDKQVSSATLWTLGGMVVGAHLLHLAFYEPRSFIDDPIRILQLGYGLASHGAILGSVLGLWVFCRRNRVSFHRWVDPVAMSCAWVTPFIRTGNFFNSEIIGRPTDLPWGVVFVRRGFLEPRHPAQLYEALVGAVLIGVALLLERRRERLQPGTPFYLLLLLYFIARFLIEFVKKHQVLDEGAFLTMGQWLSLPMIAMCAWGLRWSRTQKLTADSR